eukprot:jgi/Mesvir1/5011/Mv13897-RA.1
MTKGFFPQKTGELHNHHFDSTRWNDFKFRDDDIVIATYAKAGTTWTQQIVGQLISNGDPDFPTADASPWVDFRIAPRDVIDAGLEAQTHRRFMKTHLPLDNLVFYPKAKYIVVCRDGRDVVWSMYNHWLTIKDEAYDMINGPGLIGPPLPRVDEWDVYKLYKTWFEQDGWPLWPFWDWTRQWARVHGLPNVMFLHFNDLKKDLPGEIRRIAKFLDIVIDEAKFPEIVEHCTLEFERKNPKCVPLGGVLWKDGAASFLFKGTNRRWADILSEQEVREYEERAVKELGPKLAEWIMNGGAQEFE